MATLDSQDANIYDAETVNWKAVVYPLLAILVILIGGFGYYYYQQDQRDKLETEAHNALVQAKTPDEMIKVADQFPGTDQATLALLAAGDAYLDKINYDEAIKVYQRILSTPTVSPSLHDTAQLGLGFTLQALNKMDDAIAAYLVVAQLGDKSAYAPYAYSTVADIYDKRGDKANERKTLTQLVGLSPQSIFVKQAQEKLKQLNAANPPNPAPNAAPPVSAAPPVKP